MDRLLRTATTLGTAAVIGGAVSEFFLYDGKSEMCLLFLSFGTNG